LLLSSLPQSQRTGRDDRSLLEYFASLPDIERDLAKIIRVQGDLVRP